MKTKIIFILLSLICFFLYKTNQSQSRFSNLPVSIQDPIKLTSKKINVNNLEIDKVNSKSLYVGAMQLNKDTIKKLKNIPFKYNDEICLEDECISYEKMRQLKTFFPYGTVIPFSGDRDKIPEGWVICDGNNNTPDLRSKFILGSSDSNQLTGGSLTLNLIPPHLPEHDHDIFIPAVATDTDDVQSGEKTFSKEYKYTYLSGYAKPSPEIVYDTLEQAKAAAQENQGVGGITYEPKKKKYTLRKGNKLRNWIFNGESSWVISGGHTAVIDEKDILSNVKENTGQFMGSTDNATDLNLGDDAMGDSIIELPPFYKLIYIMRIYPKKIQQDPVLAKPDDECSTIIKKNDDGSNVDTDTNILIKQIKCLGHSPWISI